MSVLVILEQQSGKWHRLSWETLAAGQQLASQMNAELHLAVLGTGLSSLTSEPAAKKALKLWTVEHDLLGQYTADGFAAASEALVRALSPALVLLPHTYQTRDFAPKLATRFNRVLISDVTSARLEGSTPVFVRQLFQGKLSGDFRPSGPGPIFASVQAGAWRADSAEPGTAVIESFPITLDATQIRQQPEAPFRESARAVDLTAAELIVSVGRGIGEQSNIPIVEELAKAMGAELAASRPICDAGWLPMERQVGSSGQTVAPKVYLAVGISGAIQHLVGMKGAKTIVAINKDPNAPIFEVADYGIVGDLFEIAPALAAEVRRVKG